LVLSSAISLPSSGNICP